MPEIHRFRVKRIFRSERYSAFLLMGAAAAGLILANTEFGSVLFTARDTHLPVPLLGLDLTAGHWVTDGLLAVFFFLAAIELRHELTRGELDSAGKAFVPAFAALGGVIVPAAIFLLLVRDPQLSDGWPIPTATDIAFALGVLALAGRGLPSRLRALLLAIAVIDDLVAILIIAAFFTKDLQPLPLLFSVPFVIAFALLSRMRKGRAQRVTVALLIATGVTAWVLVELSGVHPTIAGVALGLAMNHRRGITVRHALEPWSNGLILPLFAFVAALVSVPDEGGRGPGPVFWAIVIALPFGKLVGITAGALTAQAISGRRGEVALGDILVVASLGGIGFTVSLLMNELAYAGNREVAAEGTLAVMLGSVIAAVLGTIITVMRSRHYRRLRLTPGRE